MGTPTTTRSLGDVDHTKDANGEEVMATFHAPLDEIYNVGVVQQGHVECRAVYNSLIKTTSPIRRTGDV